MAESRAPERRGRWLAELGGPTRIGLVTLVLAAGVKLALDPLTDDEDPLPAAPRHRDDRGLVRRVLPGLATTLLAALVGDYLFVPAGLLVHVRPRADAISLGLFLVEGSLISVLGSRLRSARRAARAAWRTWPSAEGRDDRPAARAGARDPQPARPGARRSARHGEAGQGRDRRRRRDHGRRVRGLPVQGRRPTARPTTSRELPRRPSSTSPCSRMPSAFGSPFLGAVSRSDDLARDPRYGQNLPFKQMPPGSLPARSYLAAPVRSRTGELLGGLFFGHPDPGFFHERDERLIAGLAAHAAIAVDNAHLYREAQEARAVAEAANGLKDEFLATLSHELRTPLTAIVGWADLLHRGKLSPDETTRAVDTIIRNATAQNQIIDELLDVSRIITGKLQLDLRPVDIAAVVKAAIGTVTPAADAKGIRLQLIQNPAGSYVMGDPERLQQVFWNLFSNAIKFTPEERPGPGERRVRRLERRGRRRRQRPRASTPSSFPASSTASRRTTRRARGRLAASAWACPSRASWSSSTAAASRRRARGSATAPRSRRGSPVPRSRPRRSIPASTRRRTRPSDWRKGPTSAGYGCWSWRTTTTPGGWSRRCSRPRAPP